MGLQSMTGYGRGAVKTQACSVTVELASVNRKQLDVHLKMDRELQMLEPQMVSEIGRRIVRGRVNAEIRMEYHAGGTGSSIEIDRELASDYIANLRKVAGALHLADDLGSSVLLSLPNVVRFSKSAPDAEALLPVVLKALNKALNSLIAMRRREGRALCKDLSGRLQTMERQVGGVEEKAPLVADKYRSDLLRRIREAGVTTEDQEERLLREVAFFADRSDISEEITRLRSHIKQMKQLLRSSSTEASGRAMDFIAQEMFREINTIGSKANDAGIIREVLEFKTELERFREQVQNIE
ncbi:MAG: YicC family protein [Kiritimatiellae bacterium]|nr:YicC family protein [Kiritimatiellia bacterium]MDD4735044.1 YicC family protein [Kiritimatiellia bacterium]